MASEPRGYFAVGAQGVSKAMNFGNLLRSAHAFGARFAFVVDPAASLGAAKSDTSKAAGQMPLYRYDRAADLVLPQGCKLVGVELTDEAIDLPSFRHPSAAAYVFGPERGSLSPEMLRRCDHVVKIPTKFCINLAAAGVVVMYDRLTSMGRFAPRPVKSGAPTEEPPAHVHGEVALRSGKKAGSPR